MENDIKILEELINDYRNCGLDDYPESIGDFSINKSQIWAIKNLIKENTKLRIQISARETAVDKLTQKNTDLLRKLRNRVKEVNKLTKYSAYKKEFSKLNRYLERSEKIRDYAINRITPTPEEYLEIKRIMRENKWGYEHSKKEYFLKIFD